MFYVYIIQSQLDGSFYIGQSADLEKRLTQHNHGETRTTSKKRPWKLVYSESFDSRSEAIKREHFLKKQRNRQFYQRLIDSQKC
ncbi:MAG: GIY-YIG nuclease family protein [Lewinellaceae bacterium]|nr:GIY-YIG nuclease family protein [Bacteroidota bacterium]MCB9313989.1 GIY-YIG nuclease family protein [Lewinellaceae bacterium]HRW98266.1 GIY-YIG nuclease family protein [Cyclobacteriaceae bacterium]